MLGPILDALGITLPFTTAAVVVAQTFIAAPFYILSARIGFRALGFSDDGHFYINGRPMKLRGLNRHQMFPYIGQAAPARLQRRERLPGQTALTPHRRRRSP